jgi:hypothetical protein
MMPPSGPSSTSTPPRSRFDPHAALTALRLLIAKEQVVELRVLQARKRVSSGYFRNLQKLVEAAARYDGHVKGIYITANACKSELLARANERVIGDPEMTTADHDIARRSMLVLDFDPIRPTGISSTDAQHAATIAVATRARAWLIDRGIPHEAIALLSSGNGAYLLISLDLLNDEASRDLCQAVLVAIDIIFRDDVVQLDLATFNAARIIRLVETSNQKGDEIEDRRYRRAALLEASLAFTTIHAPVDVLKQIAALAPSSQAKSAHTRDGSHKTGSGTVHDLDAWIHDHADKIPVADVGTWKTATRYRLVACIFNDQHRAPDAALFSYPGGGIDYVCLHSSCQGKTFADVRDIVEPGWRERMRARSQQEQARPEQVQATAAERAADGVRKSLATALTDLVLASRAELFHTAEARGFVTVPCGRHRETWRIKSGGFRLWLRQRYYAETGNAPSAQGLQDALEQLEARALFDGTEYPVYVRIGHVDGALYLDLANHDWQAIKIAAGTWQIVSTVPVRFTRPPGLLALPQPVRGGTLAALRPFLHVASRADFRLICSWMVMACWQRGPYPLLIFEGEQGAAKSMAQTILRLLIDPHMTPLRSEPRDVRDLMIAARNGWIAGFDNISYLGGWLSDALCRLSTGAGFATRELYTNEDEVLFSATRPVLLNGIVNPAVRADLLDRALILCLSVMDDERRRDEAELLAEFESKRPALLGALLDVVAVAHRDRPTTVVVRKPRMADFARVAAAAAPAIGWTADMFLEAYAANRGDATKVALEASPLTEPIRTIVNAGGFSGTATALLKQLAQHVDESIRKKKSWPGSPSAMSAALRRLAPNLRTIGIEVRFNRAPKGDARIISLEKMGETPSPASPEEAEDAETLKNGPSQSDAGVDGDAGGWTAGGQQPFATPSTPEEASNKAETPSADGVDDDLPIFSKDEDTPPNSPNDGQARPAGGASKTGLWPRFYFLGDRLKFPEVTTSSGVRVQAGQPGWRAFFKADTTTIVMIQTVVATVEPLYERHRRL